MNWCIPLCNGSSRMHSEDDYTSNNSFNSSNSSSPNWYSSNTSIPHHLFSSGNACTGRHSRFSEHRPDDTSGYPWWLFRTGNSVMSIHSFCRDCEHIITRMVPGIHSPFVEAVSCPARFNPMEGKWNPEQGVNPYECPRNQQFMQLMQRRNARSSRRTYWCALIKKIRWPVRKNRSHQFLVSGERTGQRGRFRVSSGTYNETRTEE